MYTIGMAKTPLLPVRIDPELVAELDAIADREGETRSALVRRALTDLVARETQAGE
jgi:predicted transcriptional regulator